MTDKLLELYRKIENIRRVELDDYETWEGGYTAGYNDGLIDVQNILKKMYEDMSKVIKE